MKKIAFIMMLAIISAAAFFAAPNAKAVVSGSRVDNPSNEVVISGSQSESGVSSGVMSTGSLLSLMPKSVVIEQTATLSDGRTVKIFYQKNGDLCEVFSNDNLNGYDVNDLINLKSTSFRIVSEPQGKRIYHTTVAKARKIVKSLVNTYL